MAGSTWDRYFRCQISCCFAAPRARTVELTGNPVSRADVYRMIHRGALAARIRTQIGNHTFRATGITDYLLNGGKLELGNKWRIMNRRRSRNFATICR